MFVSELKAPFVKLYVIWLLKCIYIYTYICFKISSFIYEISHDSFFCKASPNLKYF